ncbi:MAG TPA: hypothetical protein VF002_09620 [Gaiellaceae bacterium]
MARGSLIGAVIAAVLVLALPAFASPLPKSLDLYLLGARMIHSELALKAPDGGQNHDFQLDRGRLLKRYAAGSLEVAEENGNATLNVAAGARVILNGRSSNLRALRAGMQVLVSHDHDLPAEAVYASAAARAAPNLPRGIVSFLLGGRMMRAEIYLKSADGMLHDYLLDHGRVRQVGPTSLTLREADGTLVPIDISASARVKLNGQNASLAELRRGMMATTMRDGETPADLVYATGR